MSEKETGDPNDPSTWERRMVFLDLAPMKLTGNLRWERRNTSMADPKGILVLQQEWQNQETGECEWKDVPTVKKKNYDKNSM